MTWRFIRRLNECSRIDMTIRTVVGQSLHSGNLLQRAATMAGVGFKSKVTSLEAGNEEHKSSTSLFLWDLFCIG